MYITSVENILKDAFKHIMDFQKKSSSEIVGIVFYAGETVLSFGDEYHKRYALPLSIFF